MPLLTILDFWLRDNAQKTTGADSGQSSAVAVGQPVTSGADSGQSSAVVVASQGTKGFDFGQDTVSVTAPPLNAPLTEKAEHVFGNVPYFTEKGLHVFNPSGTVAFTEKGEHVFNLSSTPTQNTSGADSGASTAAEKLSQVVIKTETGRSTAAVSSSAVISPAAQDVGQSRAALGNKILITGSDGGQSSATARFGAITTGADAGQSRAVVHSTIRTTGADAGQSTVTVKQSHAFVSYTNNGASEYIAGILILGTPPTTVEVVKGSAVLKVMKGYATASVEK